MELFNIKHLDLRRASFVSIMLLAVLLLPQYLHHVFLLSGFDISIKAIAIYSWVASIFTFLILNFLPFKNQVYLGVIGLALLVLVLHLLAGANIKEALAEGSGLYQEARTVRVQYEGGEASRRIPSFEWGTLQVTSSWQKYRHQSSGLPYFKNETTASELRLSCIDLPASISGSLYSVLLSEGVDGHSIYCARDGSEKSCFVGEGTTDHPVSWRYFVQPNSKSKVYILEYISFSDTPMGQVEIEGIISSYEIIPDKPQPLCVTPSDWL